MTLYQNIHPGYPKVGILRKWETCKVQIHGKNLGDAVTFELIDSIGDTFTMVIHYGEDPQGLIDRMKIAVLSLPAIVREDAAEKEEFPPFNIKTY